MLALKTKREDARPGRGEDRIEVVSLADRAIVVVADGAGGVAGGATTAETVCKAVVERGRQGGVNDWAQYLSTIDREMANAPGLAAAVVVEVRDDGTVVGASVGDCEAWTFENGSEPRNLTAEQVRKPLLGEGRAFPVGFHSHVKECSLLVATDGLWKYLDRARIAKAAATRPLETACDLLVAGVRLRSGALQDDVAVAIIECK
jgi:serine/threonine protein phosphatase PrpC